MLRRSTHCDAKRMSANRTLRLCAGLLFALGAAGSAHGASSAPIEVAAGVYAVMGERGEIGPANRGRVANSAFIVGPRGVAVIDSGISFRHGEAIIAAVRSVTRRPVRILVITHPSEEVVFGAAAFQKRRIPVLMHGDSAALMSSRCDACLRNLDLLLGAHEMAGSRVVTPDRLVTRTEPLDVIGRPLLLIAPPRGSAPGALAVFDPTTRTLVAGSLASIGRIPDLRDANGRPWRGALAMLEATHCLHLIPAYGRVGRCDDINALDDYFAALERRVHRLLDAGIGLAELNGRSDLPRFAHWDGYAERHLRNVNRAYLRMERASFAN